MNEEKINMFLAVNGNKFQPYQLQEIKNRLSQADDNTLAAISALDLKTPSTMLIISILVGGLGVDRFMMGEVGLGVIKLITCGGFGIWTIIDWFTVQGRAKDYNYKLLSNVL